MRILVSKSLALEIYYYCRQADRAVHFSLNSTRQWARLRAIYARRLPSLQNLANRLNAQIGERKPGPLHKDFERLPWFWFLRLPFKLILNQMKSKWCFTQEELCFISNTLASFLTTLEQTTKPSFDALLALRMDLVMSESLVDNHLFGTRELKAVDSEASHPDQFWGAESGIPEIPDEFVA